MNYTHLSLEERHYIELSKKEGKSTKIIASDLNRSYSTIRREIIRNEGQRGYRYQQANNKAKERHTTKNKAIKLTDAVKIKIDIGIEEDWSPEQVSGRLKKTDGISLHHETIYQYILKDKLEGGDLHTHLRTKNKRYKKRYGAEHNRNGIIDRVDIDERPQEANDRARIGGWEADTIIGKGHQGSIVTLDERKSKVRLSYPLNSKHAKGVTAAIVALLLQKNYSAIRILLNLIVHAKEVKMKMLMVY